jgi:polyhydroxybutyrate depolymerase
MRATSIEPGSSGAAGDAGSSQEGSTGWKQEGDSTGFITVFPNGIGNSWSVGRCCSAAQSGNVDDVQFTRDMIKWLEAHSCVDPKRIYASGGSNGGGMSYMVACYAAAVIAAVAPVDFDCITAPGGPTARPSTSPVRSQPSRHGSNSTRARGSPTTDPNSSKCQTVTTCGGGTEVALCTALIGFASDFHTLQRRIDDATHTARTVQFRAAPP